MAKKNPEDYTVEEKLKNLYALQTILSSIDEKRALRGELPHEVQDYEDSLEGLKARQERIATEIQDYKKAISMREGEIEEAKMLIDRYKAQLDEVQNNRQYDSLTKEIEFQGLQIQHCEKLIRETNQKIEER
ncbi:MAG: hypothetical protein HUK05_03300, partial [Prevotella sp.]|nr:hypothetical protein [Prevotella sp.]